MTERMFLRKTILAAATIRNHGCYHRGWSTLRPDDLGSLWEPFVLNELLAVLQGEPLHYWRDEAGHEVDFVLRR